MSPCARWCGRALSSSWKLPPRGARRARPGGGERRGRARPPVPGEGSAPPPCSPRGGEERREKGRGGSGARKRGVGGRGFPPHPPPREQRVPAAAPCRPQRPAPRAPPRPREGRRGRRRRRGRGNRSRDLQELTGFLSENFREAGWADLVPAGVGHISLQPGDLPSTLQQRGTILGEAVG